jgi:hypothetical protein
MLSYMETDYQALMLEEMDWAIAQKIALGIKRGDDFKMRVKVVDQDGAVGLTPARWHSRDEMHAMMETLSRVCGTISARAAIITSDARFMQVKAFCEHFAIELPTSENIKAWEKKRRSIMRSYDNEMSKLPRPLWSEALMVGVKGPGVEKGLVSHYRVADDKYVFDPPTFNDDAEMIWSVKMLPAWWQ